MSLIDNKKGCDVVEHDCVGKVTDCVGKVGDCPIVVSVEDCKFDRADQVFTEVRDCVGKVSDQVREYADVEEVPMNMDDFYAEQNVDLDEDELYESPIELDDGKRFDMEEFLDDMIRVLIKHHNRLVEK